MQVGRYVVATRTLLVAVTGSVLMLMLMTVLVIAGRSVLPGAGECFVRASGREVALSTTEAERVALVAAHAIRDGRGVRASLGDPGPAYVEDAADARAVAAALSGKAPHALTCAHGGAQEQEPDRLDAAGLTARAERVRRDVDLAFGRQSVGGFAPGGVREGHMPGSAHYAGRAIDIFFRPVTARRKVRGWAMAQYLVANAERLAVTTVIYDAKIWTSRRAGEGWRDYTPDVGGKPRRVARVLEHRDHVHVDVAD